MVPASIGRTMNAPIEYVRSSIGDDFLAAPVQAANDELDADLGTVLEAVIDLEPAEDPGNKFCDTNATNGLPFKAENGTGDDFAAIIIPVSQDHL